jgi:hypothetical protein
MVSCKYISRHFRAIQLSYFNTLIILIYFKVRTLDNNSKSKIEFISFYHNFSESTTIHIKKLLVKKEHAYFIYIYIYIYIHTEDELNYCL